MPTWIDYKLRCIDNVKGKGVYESVTPCPYQDCNVASSECVSCNHFEGATPDDLQVACGYKEDNNADV